MTLTQQEFAGWADGGCGGVGRVSRRSFIAGAAGAAAGIAATSRLWFPIVARADDEESLVAPRPIPQTVAPGAPFHVVLPASGTEPATITDFRGKIGLADLGGTGVGVTNGQRESLLHAADVRFMSGRYVGVDNRRHEGTFVFV